MALEVASLYATLGLDKKNFDKGLKQAGKSFSDLAGDAISFAAGGLIEKGISAIGAGLVEAGSAGFEFNNSLEQVTARFNAFTKDGAKTAEILEMIKDRAAKTPFEFEEMATAAAGLMPAAKQSGIALEDLIAQAEILAASNPAQGLEGAAFSLREALSGDFVSIVERFNLPKQRLKELKDEGVPAMEAISIAMKEMGLDADLVANMSETASGRMSTLSDTFTNLEGIIVKPIFDTFSEGLGGLNKWLAENEPMLTAMAETIAGKLATGLENAARFTGEFLDRLGDTGKLQMVSETFGRFGESANKLAGAIGGLGQALGLNNDELEAMDILLAPLLVWLEGLNVILDIIALQFDTWTTAINTLSNALSGVLAQGKRFGDWLGTLDDDIPDWLRPGSPTKFEMGLRGISDAMGQMPLAPAGGGGRTTNLNLGSLGNFSFQGAGGTDQALMMVLQLLRGQLGAA